MPKMLAQVSSCPPILERKYLHMERALASAEGSTAKAPGLVAITYCAQEPMSPVV